MIHLAEYPSGKGSERNSDFRWFESSLGLLAVSHRSTAGEQKQSHSKKSCGRLRNTYPFQSCPRQRIGEVAVPVDCQEAQVGGIDQAVVVEITVLPETFTQPVQ